MQSDGAVTIKCHQCVHYFITHHVTFRYGCRALGFKSKSQPCREVMAASGEPCRYFERKAAKIASRAP